MREKLDAHLFICTNQKEKGECCANRGGEVLRNEVKKAALPLKDLGKLRINASGCLGHCEDGITAVLYPEGKWFTHLEKDSVEVLVEAVKDSLTK